LFRAAQSVCDQTKKALVPLKDQFAKLQQHINADNYYKFIQLWKNDLQQIVFMLAFITWLESKRLIDLQEIEQFLGRKCTADINTYSHTNIALSAG
jgi:hypothetical protein